MAERTCFFGLAAEDNGGALAVTVLGDRILAGVLSEPPEDLEGVRAWRGAEPGSPWLDVHGAHRRAIDTFLSRGRHFSPRMNGGFGDRRGAPDARLFRTVLALFNALAARPDLVVIARDTDRKREETEAFDQACSVSTWPFQVILAAMHPESEAWYIAGFVPEPGEQDRLKEARRALGFDPTEEPHRLTARKQGDPRDAKRWLDYLTGEDTDRKRVCLDTSLETLRRRGSTCGLTDYLRDFESGVRGLPFVVTGDAPDGR